MRDYIVPRGISMEDLNKIAGNAQFTLGCRRGKNWQPSEEDMVHRCIQDYR